MSSLFSLAMIAAGMFLGSLGTHVARLWTSRVSGAAASDSLTAVAAALEQAKTELNAQRAETERARKRADEYFATIEGTVNEANVARRAYLQCAVEHGAAQGMMMREIERLALAHTSLSRLYREKTGDTPPELKIDPVIVRVAREFASSHGPD